MTNQPSCAIVIFGATGDLAKRKLFPSLYNLFKNGNLSHRFSVVGVARRKWSNDYFRERVIEAVQEASGETVSEEEARSFSEHFYYHPFDVTDTASFTSLKQLLDQLDHTYDIPNNRLFYLAMAPEYFGTIALHLNEAELTNVDGWKRLVIEKPFGHDLPSAEILNDQIREVFKEEEIFRIDHYLGKEMVQNIEVIRFANAMFEHLWSNRFIANVQITSSESIDVGDRGHYYEKSGALRDMVQNHMLQMVSLLAMEPPINLSTEEVRGEKVKVLRSLRKITKDDVDQYVVRGQYGPGEVDSTEIKGFRENEKVTDESNTETFVAAKLMIDNHRWAGVPFYIRTGKSMTVKSTQIVIEFKDLPMNLYSQQHVSLGKNLLTIHIQPDEGITLQMNVKKPGSNGETTPIAMEFSKKSALKMNSPEAYERLMHDCMLGDATNFTRWDEVAYSWRFIDPIAEHWQVKKEAFPNYAAGTMGPEAADQLLAADGFHWWPIKNVENNTVVSGKALDDQ
ncbi:glucose-6-phosphate dehydrogenase [Bacillaceae bacterium SIJ1]|uniref:glucose-6-phosphate dehydrogenase n=1 Tax=Litoribacterium kuwaitense TaxID=1398745 RepID=UPI0013ECA95E|nr:glucose-6-phosphate dehydrogenase [Litoribacterium kuwaitense]NGP46754.1 glucose-6-phosphate dehydrogenase [Litoribacterium kuwaitense]